MKGCMSTTNGKGLESTNGGTGEYMTVNSRSESWDLSIESNYVVNCSHEFSRRHETVINVMAKARLFGQMVLFTTETSSMYVTKDFQDF